MITGEIYILVAEVNDYNQYGKYYIDSWTKIPSKEELQKTIESSNLEYDAIDYELILKTIEDKTIDTRIKPTASSDAWFSFIVKN